MTMSGRARKGYLRAAGAIPALAALALAFAVACGGAPAPTATSTRQAAGPTPTTAATRLPTTATTPTAPPQVQPTETATPRPAASPTTVARPAASRGKIVYAKPVDLGSATALTVGTAGGPDTPFTSSINANFTARTPQGELIPWLAAAWKFSSNDKVLDVTIRSGAVFQDGSPVTADDVVYSLDKLWLHPIQPGAPPPSGRPAYPTKIEKTGPDSIRITYDSPDPNFLTEVMNIEGPAGGGPVYVYPQAAIERMGFDAFLKAPVGAGPYKLAKRSAAEYVILEAHERFFNGPPAVKTIEVRIAPEDSTRVAMFRTGEADIAESIAPQYLPDLEKLSGARILSVRSGQEVVVNIQTRPQIPCTDLPNPFADVRVRRALIHATDRKTIAERIAGRAGVPVVGPYSTFHLGAAPDKIADYEYNPEKAKQLLKEANFPMDYQFPVYAYAASAPAPQAVESFTNYLQAVGLKAQYRLVEVSSLIRMWRTKEAFPMSFVRSWSVYADPTNHYNLFLRTTAQSSFDADAEMDRIVDDALKIADPVKHAQAFEKFFVYLHQQAYVVNLYAIVDNHGIGPKVVWRYPPGLPSRLDLVTWRQ
jgi:peptide/nickel transport system substrate-binding protein